MKHILNLILAVVLMNVAVSNAATSASCGLREGYDCIKGLVNTCINGPATNGVLMDDWVVSPETHPLCGGYYVEPCSPEPNKTALGLPAETVTITANRGQFVPEGPSLLQGNVHLIQGNKQVLASEANIYRNVETGEVETVEARGGVEVREPGLRIVGTRADVFVDEDRKVIYDAEYRIYEKHARGVASCITAYGNGRTVLRNASYSTCAPCNDTWILKARKIALNKISGRGQATHSYLYLKGIPVFYSPYFDFPIDDRRQTGFLDPIFGNTRKSGTEFAAPFYWNIAPNYDAIITPRYLSKRGIDLQGEGRYLTQHNTGRIQGSILPHDRAYKKFRQENMNTTLFPQNDPRVTALRRGNNSRRRIYLDHNSTFNRNWTAKLNYHRVGDDNFFMDLGDSLETANNLQLLQEGMVTYQDLYWMVQGRVQEYQTLHPFEGPVTSDPYRRTPQIGVFNSVPDLPYGFLWTTQGDFSHFTRKRERDPIAPNHTTGKRYQIRPGIALPLVQPGWFLKPRLQWNYWGYDLNQGRLDTERKKPRTPSINMPMVDVDSGLIFERPMEFCQIPFIQTLEPRIYYLWVPFRNQNKLPTDPTFDTAYPGFNYNTLFRDNRFSGLDRMGDANQATFALSTRILTDSTGAERANATIGQIYYFKDRRVTLCDSDRNPLCIEQEMPEHNKHRSNFVGLARYHLTEAWTATATGQWNPYKSRGDEAAAWLQYRPDELNVFNVGYLFLRRNPAQIDPITFLPKQLKQAEVSFAVALTERWRILSRYQYDLKMHRGNEFLAGIEQQNCCTAIRLSYVRYIQPNDPHTIRENKDVKRKYLNTFYFQFIFKGLTSVGHSKINTVTTRIPGYQFNRDQF